MNGGSYLKFFKKTGSINPHLTGNAHDQDMKIDDENKDSSTDLSDKLYTLQMTDAVVWIGYKTTIICPFIFFL